MYDYKDDLNAIDVNAIWIPLRLMRFYEWLERSWSECDLNAQCEIENDLNVSMWV